MMKIRIPHIIHLEIQVFLYFICFLRILIRELAADPKLHGGYWGPWKEHPEHWPRSETLRQSENDVFA